VYADEGGGGDRRTSNLGPPAGVPDRRQGGRRASDAIEMSCPYCAVSESTVVDSRGDVERDTVRRRRECASCRRRFPTQQAIDWRALLREFNGDDTLMREVATLLRDHPNDDAPRQALRQHLAGAATRDRN
jgi:hypothetical protein